MKFKLSTSGRFYHKDSQKALKKLGFVFRGTKYGDVISDHMPEIEFNTLDDLIKFSDEWGELIVHGDEIEIYDNYRE